MKFTIERVAICILIFVITIMIMRDCSRPSEQKEAEDRKAFEIADAINKAEKMEAQAIQDSLKKVWIDSIAKINVVVKAQDKRITVLVKQAARQRTPKVDTLILDNPDLKSFVDTQTEIIQEQRVQIDTLKSVIAFQRKLNEDLINAEFVEDKIEAQMAIEASVRISDLERSAKKRERKSKLRGILVPVALIGGFLFGASL